VEKELYTLSLVGSLHCYNLPKARHK